jgi:hypothetical protein
LKYPDLGVADLVNELALVAGLWRSSSITKGIKVNKSVSIAAALVLALALGYGISVLINKQAKPLTGPCSIAKVHCADVTIVSNSIQDIPDIEVPGKSEVIFWTIVTPGYTFPANGISFVTAPIPPDDEFKCMVIAVGETVFFCIDKNSTHGSGPKTYKYTVTVNGSSAVTPLDPQIINN